MDKYSTNTAEGEVLQNKLGLTDLASINEEEVVGMVRTKQQAIETLNISTAFPLEYLYKLHEDAFGHLYDFAGKLRTVDMSKDGFMFPAAKYLPENLREFEKKFLVPLGSGALDGEALQKHLAALHAELLYIHPFREGNGRIIRLFTELISLAKAGKEPNFAIINKEGNFKRYVAAVQEAAGGTYDLMQELFAEM